MFVTESICNYPKFRMPSKTKEIINKHKLHSLAFEAANVLTVQETYEV